MSAVNTGGFSLSCVILTRGDRPDELARAIESVRAQHGEPIQIIVVGNGVSQLSAPSDAEVLHLPENIGIPGGRNIGTEHAKGDAIIYLDDDGWLPDRGSAEHLRRAFLADDQLGVVTFRILDPETGRTERRHVPRLRVGNPERSSYVTTFLGGACAVRRRTLDDCGEFPAHFFYSHEETDFAWRALDRGYHIRYDAGMLMYHPGGDARSRHDEHHFYNARNRVWLARRHLPRMLGVAYLLSWAIVTITRERRRAALVRWVDGIRAGLEGDPGRREPVSTRTLKRMSILGRPPII